MSSSASSAVRENASGVLYDLLTDAAGAGLLEKAVFSKCRDRAVVRIVLTLRLVRDRGQWWVLPDQALLSAVSGGLLGKD